MIRTLLKETKKYLNIWQSSLFYLLADFLATKYGKVKENSWSELNVS